MKRPGMIKNEHLIVLAVIVVVAALTVYRTFSGQSSPQDSKQEAKNEKKEITTASGLKYTDLKVGTGDKAKIGTTVGVMYVGTFSNGEKFDGNIGKQPYPVTIGDGMVIKGWEEGLMGMQNGGKRKLVVPYQLAYGEEGRPPRIPPKAELHFEIEVVSLVNK